jgi:filamentous hemagglutinin family protein
MMGRVGLLIVVSALLAAATGCGGTFKGKSPGKKVTLFNGQDFTGWTRFIEDPNTDVDDVWRIRGDVLYCAGKPNGYIRTTEKYKNYHLHLEWRWPETPTNSGVLLHANGKDEVWPACIECQLKAGGAGDLVLINGTGISINGVSQKNSAKRFVVIEKKSPMSELPAGQWNRYDIYCQGDSIRCLVNGVAQNEGTDASVTSGWICLQSEGSPIEFRNITLEPLN